MEPEPLGGAAGLPIRIRYDTRLSEQLRAAMFASRRSNLSFAFAVAALLAAIGQLLLGDPVAFVLTLLLGISLVTGLFSVPFAWWAAREQPTPAGSEIEDVIDAVGITETTPRISAHIAWSACREVAETGDTFYLSIGSGLGFIPKRALTPAQVEELRRLFASLSLVRPRRRFRRVLIVLAVLAILIAFAIVLLIVETVGRPSFRSEVILWLT
jgi:YcxB-like protein